MRRDLPTLTLGETTLEWSRVATGYDGGTGWLHSGVAVLPDGDVLMAHPEGRDLLRVSTTGGTGRICTELTEMHCLTVATNRDGTTMVWAADNGHRFVHDTPSYGEIQESGRVVALDLDGAIVRELLEPSVFGAWSPTSVAPVDPADPHSDVWVADGYGQSLVHRYSADGTLLASLDGAPSGTPFDCPHGIVIRSTGTERLLYVADRANQRIVVLDLDGTCVRTFGEEVLDSPSSMVDYRGRLLVTELFGSVAVFGDDGYLGHLGSAARDHTEPGWPNRIDETGSTVAPDVVDGRFNSPHGIAAGNGSLFITEWMIGGRLVRLGLRAPTGPIPRRV